MEGTRPLTGPALPNLINAVSILKSKSRSKQRGFDFDFNILTAFIRLGRARPAGAGCPPYYYLQTLCPSYYYLTFFFPDFLILANSSSADRIHKAVIS